MITRIFINRKIEKKFFQEDITLARSKSRIVIISSPSGLGKSSLIDEVVKNKLNYDLDHRVKIKQSESEECDLGFFIKRIVKMLDINALHDQAGYLRFHEFSLKKNLLEIIGEITIKKIFSSVGIDNYLDHVKSTEDNIQEWLGNEFNLLLLGKEYIKYVLRGRKLILAIENIQNIDNYSVQVLKEIIQSTNNAYLIFEYTTGIRYNFSIPELHDFFQAAADISEYTLSKLDKAEIIKTLGVKDDIIIGILNESYDTSDGNLFKLSLLLNDAKCLKLHKELVYSETIKNLVNNFNNSIKAILIIIESHRNGISYTKLYELIATHLSDLINCREIDTSLRLLMDNYIIECTPIDIKLTHDSLFKELNKLDELKKIYIVVLRRMAAYYKEKNQEKLSIEERINNYLYLISFYLKLNSFLDIIEILEQINDDLASFPIDTVLNYLNLIRATYDANKLDDEFDKEIIKWSVYIYFRCGYYKKIIDEISFSTIEDIRVKLCYIAALSSESPQEAMNIIMSNKEKDSIYNLGLKLVELRTLRSLRKKHDCYNLWMEYYENKVFNNSLWEGDFLRYSCLCIHNDLEFRIKRIKEAYNIFRTRNNSYGIIASCLTLMRDYLFMGNYKKANKWMNEASYHIQKAVFPMYMFYNNQSVLGILAQDISGKVLLNLYRALEICTNSDDSIAIQSNLLCCCIIQKDKNSGVEFYQNLLVSLRKSYYQNSSIFQSVVYNCYKYAKLIDDEENIPFLASHYSKLLTNNYPQVPSIIRSDFFPVLIVNWDIDYYTVLNNYQ
ncbi:hypothetical protein [Bacteroides ndongoniae]|uniref:hypothetical protein n=2 Tax=Bacteroides TaxID=816 RepID=UPI0008DA9FC7|nr:hypothetical protein [Bacteroides ndongoniae]